MLEEGFASVAKTGEQIAVHICVTLRVTAAGAERIRLRGSRAVFPQGDPNRPEAGREVGGVARHDEPRPLAHEAGQA